MLPQFHTTLVLLLPLILISSSPFCFSSYPLPKSYHPHHDNETFTMEHVEDNGGGISPAPSASPHRNRSNGDRILLDARYHPDHTEAFNEAWEKVCSVDNGVLVVSRYHKYTLKPITFSGPCNGGTTVKLYGTLQASTQRSDYSSDLKHWITFDNVRNLNVEGGGTIDGNGQVWWPNSCKVDKSKPCRHAPTAVEFRECTNLRVNNLRISNAQQMHVVFKECVNVIASNLMISAPGHSPNTDGIHVTGTRNIRIINSLIETGDDCISIVSGSSNVYATDITCGPGHGISIGSLGADHESAYVSNVMVNRATISGTQNGVRIKTWQGGSGVAQNIIFQNIVMRDVSNPIIIDQNYCDQNKPCKQQKGAVRISNVTYNNIKGTSHTKMAIDLSCSKSFPCTGILLQNVDLAHEGEGSAEAGCLHVSEMVHKGSVSPRCDE
ncbi:hypothetical protein Ancab_034992 [Ancistrocladus abbreviatus]